jgi:tight adherence protein B
VIALASTLLAIAGLLAERSIGLARREVLRDRLGTRAAPRRPKRLPPAAVPAVCGVASIGALGPAWTGILAATVFAAHRLVRRRRRDVAARRRDEQLPDVVAALAAGLRGGLSLSGALAYARDEADAPSRQDLAQLVGRIDVGVPVVSALGEWAERVGSEDARLLVGVLDVHHRSGGDLPVVLDGVVATLRERRAADREVRALTAQARLSGAILGTLPIGFFAFLLLTSRREMFAAIGTPIGRVAIGVGLGLELAAFVWIRRLLEVR